MKTYTRQDVEKFRRSHYVTPNGVVFNWWLVSAEGAGFCLIKETHTTDEDLRVAEAYLLSDRDVVGKISVAVVETDEAVTIIKAAMKTVGDLAGACEKALGPSTSVPDGDYVDDSFEIDFAAIAERNQLSEEDNRFLATMQSEQKTE